MYFIIYFQFSAGLDEVVLIPQGRGKKFAETCIRSDIKKRVSNVHYCDQCNM